MFCVSEPHVLILRNSAMKVFLEQVPLFLHLCVELPASLSFLLRPSATLTVPQPYSHGVIRQYALLLLTTNIIVVLLLMRPMDLLTHQVCGALVLYHIGPFIRAATRIRKQEPGSALGGPIVHAFAHTVCIISLAASFMSRF